MLPENIKKMLSGDIEMAQLGASLIPQFIKQKALWERVLEEYLNPQYTWDIIKKEIYVRYRISQGIWAQLPSTGYIIKTGRGGMKIIEEAFKKFKTNGKNKRSSKANSGTRRYENASRRFRTKSKILESTIRDKRLQSQGRVSPARVREISRGAKTTRSGSFS